MTNKYKVTQVEDFGVVVDENVTATSFVLLPDGTIKEMGHTSLLDYLESESNATKNIMATIGKRLGAIPFIELPSKESTGGFPEDLWEKYRKPLNRSMTHFERDAFIGGYKANTNKYSEEDMQAAWEGGVREGGFVKDNSKDSFKLEIYPQFIERISKLTIPTEVELEIQIKSHNTGGQLISKEFPIIHNKETNTITAINASYDKEI